MLLMLLVVLLFDWKIDTLLHIILEIHLLCVFFPLADCCYINNTDPFFNE